MPMLREKPETRLKAEQLIYEAQEAIQQATELLESASMRSSPVAGVGSHRPQSNASQYSHRSRRERESDGSQKSAPKTFFANDPAKFVQSPHHTVIGDDEYQAYTHSEASNVGNEKADLLARKSTRRTNKRSSVSGEPTLYSTSTHQSYPDSARRNTKRRPSQDEGHDSENDSKREKRNIDVQHGQSLTDARRDNSFTSKKAYQHRRDRPTSSRDEHEAPSTDSLNESQHRSPVQNDEDYARGLQRQFDALEVGPSQSRQDEQRQHSGAKDKARVQTSDESRIPSSQLRNKTSTRVLGRIDPPYLSVENALRWRLSRGHQALDDEKYRQYLGNRDHVSAFGGSVSHQLTSLQIFLVDDSDSMKPLWGELQGLLDILAYMTKFGDDDGLELLFMTEQRGKQSKNSRGLVQRVKEVEAQGRVDATVRLGEISQKYQATLQGDPPRFSSRLSGLLRPKSPRPPKGLSIYVMTTGQWQPGCEVDEIIKNLVNKLVECRISPAAVGILFGNDPEGKTRLKRLDDDLNLSL